MGVKGLHSYVESKLPASEHMLTLAELAAASCSPETASSGPTPSRVIVVDGMALIRKMYTPELEWVVGGQFQELWVHVADFVSRFTAHSLSLVLFFDGGVDEAKLGEWQTRRQADLRKVERVIGHLSRGEPPPKSCWMPPPNISKIVGGAFAEQGCDVHYTAGEADREIASFCIHRRCAAVLGKDSDFIVLPVGTYLNLDTLQLHTRPERVTAYRRSAIEAALGLPSSLLPLLGSLVGNDYVPTQHLSRWHASLMPGRHAAGAPLIEAVARRVAAAATATSWHGPRPTTPVLWCAPNLARQLAPPLTLIIPHP